MRKTKLSTADVVAEQLSRFLPVQWSLGRKAKVAVRNRSQEGSTVRLLLENGQQITVSVEVDTPVDAEFAVIEPGYPMNPASKLYPVLGEDVMLTRGNRTYGAEFDF